MAPAPGFAPRGLLVQGPGSVVTGSGFNRNRYTLRGLDNKALREYTYNRDTLGWTVDCDLIYRGSGQLPASWSQAEGSRHFPLDHLGTPRLITNASAAPVAFHRFFPYGEEATAINPNGSWQNTPGSWMRSNRGSRSTSGRPWKKKTADKG